MSDAEAAGRGPHLSIVAPVHNEHEVVAEFVARLEEHVPKVTDDYEIVLIEDGSTDSSWQAIESACAMNAKVKGVRLSRNFGQHFAIAAGLDTAKGDFVVVMDCDLQHDPEYIPALYERISDGYDIVYARHPERKHGFLKNLTSTLYYKLLNSMSEFDQDPHIGAFSIINRKVVDAFQKFGDYRIAYLLVLQWLGFRVSHVEVEHRERFAGETSYTVIRLLRHALTVTIAFSDRVLYFTVFVGMFFAGMAFAAIVGIIAQYFFFGIGVVGWASTIVAIAFFSGVNLMALGVSGIYIAKVFEQTKGRPRYLVGERLNQ